MGQHYTRNTVSATEWCKKCAKQTPHRVDDRRLGPCLVCIDNFQPVKPKAPKAEQQGLFNKERE